MTVDMGIVKLEINLGEMTQMIQEFKQNRLSALETISQEVKKAVTITINQLLHAEMTIFLGKSDQIKNKRNGYRTRDYAMKGLGSVSIRMPLDRHQQFKSDIIPKGEQIDPRLKEDMAVLHLAGLSTRTLAMVSKRLLGVEISQDTVTQSLAVVEEKALKWLSRPITQDYWALFVDGTNFRIQRRGSTEKEPSLVVLGIDHSNRMSILSIEPGIKDNVTAWASVFTELRNRGLNCNAVKIGIMDGLPGLEILFKEYFSASVTARCWVHALKNAMGKVPARLEEPFKLMAHKVMYAKGESDAREAFSALKAAMGQDAQKAVHCLEKDLDALVVHYRFDSSLWRTLRTTNPIERVNKELKRRTKSMETLGERTLNILLAFTALRLEFNWQRAPVNSKSRENLKFVNTNSTEATIEALLH